MNRIFYALTLIVPALTSATAAADPPKSVVEQVIIVFKTHFDIGYTDMASNVVQRYRTTMIDQALDVVDQNRNLPEEQQFVWTIPGWPMKQILADWRGQTAERRARVMNAFQEGRFVVHALPFTTHTELLELEDLVRGMGYSSRLSGTIGKALPRDAKMTDVPSHSWIMPTLLKNAGVDFLHLGCNPASSSPSVPLLFWWEGPDGSRLLTMYSAGDYGGGLVPPADWPHKTWLALVMTGDNHGPPRPEEVKLLLEQARTRLPGVKVRIGRLSDFYDAVVSEQPRADIPVVRGDMTDTWIYGPMATPDGSRQARNLRPIIAAAELLGTELSFWGAEMPDLRGTVAAAYEQSLLYGEHTWGGAFSWIYRRYMQKYGKEWAQERAAGRFKRIESSWDEHSAYIENCGRLIGPLWASESERLAGSVKVRGPRVVVFNPLPWARSGVVDVEVAGSVDELVESASRQAVPFGRGSGNAITFVANDVPPGGYRTFLLKRGGKGQKGENSPAVEDNVLENEFFKLSLNAKLGTVDSLVDKRSGRELVDKSADQGFGQHLYERFDLEQVRAFTKAYVKIDAEWGTNELGKPSLPPASEVSYRAASPEQFRVRFEHTPVSSAAILEARASGGVPHGVTTRFTLYREQPWVDVEMTVHDKPLEPWPEAGWICLPFKLTQPVFRLGRLGSVVDPAKDIVPGCNFHQFALNGGLTATEQGGYGVGICPLDSPLVSLGEPGCWKYSKTFAPRQPRVFVNLFNNQWSTNFRLWNGGTWSSRVRLWLADGEDAGRNLITPAEEVRSPLMAAYGDGPAGKLPTTQAGLRVSRTGLKVTAFGPNPDGEGLVLRLWELSGAAGPVQVELPAGCKARSVQPVDLRGRAKGPEIPVNARLFTVELKPFAPAGFTLR